MDADVESKGDLIRPGDPGFAESLRSKIQCFRDIRGTILRTWAKEKGLLRDDSSLDEINNVSPQTDAKHHRDQGQLYVLLYIETLVRICSIP